MRTAWLIIVVAMLYTGCKRGDRIPANVLPQKEMQTVLWDMMRVDQYLTDYVLPHDSALDKKAETIRLYQQVFSIHKITEEEFQRSFSFYKSHPALLKVIMDSISKVSAAPTQIIKIPVESDTTGLRKID